MSENQEQIVTLLPTSKDETTKPSSKILSITYRCSWKWIFGGLFTIIVIGAIVGYFYRNRKKTKAQESCTSPQSSQQPPIVSQELYQQMYSQMYQQMYQEMGNQLYHKISHDLLQVTPQSNPASTVTQGHGVHGPGPTINCVSTTPKVIVDTPPLSTNPSSISPLPNPDNKKETIITRVQRTLTETEMDKVLENELKELKVGIDGSQKLVSSLVKNDDEEDDEEGVVKTIPLSSNSPQKESPHLSAKSSTSPKHPVPFSSFMK